MVSGLGFGVLFIILIVSGTLMAVQNHNQTNPQPQSGHITTRGDMLQYPPPTNPSHTPPSGVSSDVTPSAPPQPSADALPYASPYASPSAPLSPPANTTSYRSTDQDPPSYESVVGTQPPPQQVPSGKPPDVSKADATNL